MDRLQYNILLEEAGIYEKRKLKKEEVYDSDSDFIYKETNTDCIYEIIPNDLSTEELKIVLLTKQLDQLNSVNKNVGFLTIIIAIPLIISLIILFITMISSSI